MDLDKSLDDMIPKRGPRADRGGRGGRGGAERKPRISRDRTDAAPYAVSHRDSGLGSDVRLC